MSRAGPASRATRIPPAARAALVAAAIALLTAWVYAPVREFPFVVYDDKLYVTENPLVLGGLSAASVERAFTEPATGNYVPLTWLSHMLDVELFGLEAGGHHAVNAALHGLAALLLFFALRRATGDLWPAAFVAACFALHPLRVESVAWVSERRDTLSGVFFALTLWAWSAAVASPGRAGRLRGQALAAASLGLGLLAKPMLVTLPFLLLLLDLWPLRRTDLPLRQRLLEKVPLFSLVVLASAAAVWSQGGAGAVASFSQVPLGARLANACTSAASYLAMTLWPFQLAVFYPFELKIPTWRWLSSAALLLGLSAAAWSARRRQPSWLVGWLWYLGMLVPVIGLVQIGSQGLADRYVYLPGLGLAVAVAWGAAGWAARRRRRAPWLAVAAVLLLGFWTLRARDQVWVWQDSVTLFEHARSVTGDNPVVQLNLGEAHDDAGRAERAIEHYRATLVGWPHARRVHQRLGALLAERGQLEQAAAVLDAGLGVHPDEPGLQRERGRVLLRAGRVGAAAEALEAERVRSPDDAVALFHLAEVRALQGREEQAAGLFAEALAGATGGAPEPLRAHSSAVLAALAEGLFRAGRADQAAQWAQRGLMLARLAGEGERAAALERALERYRADPES